MIKTKRTSLLTICLLIIGTSVFSQQRKKKQAQEDMFNWRYEIECQGNGVQGTYLIKVWSYSKNPNVALAQAKKNAVHGIIFKGFVSNEITGCKGQKPLTNNVNLQDEHRIFFDSFFADGGRYQRFVNVSNDGTINPQDRVKIKRVGYKIGLIVSVNKSALRKDLEEAGIIKKLTKGF